MSALPRRWLELGARIGPDDPRHDLVAEALVRLGARAVEERAEGFVTHLSEPPDLDVFLDAARRALIEVGLPDVELTVGWRADEDWAETWKRGLEPRRVGRRLVVTPSWCRVDAEADDIVLVLDPGMAFGNAEHGTTRGCLRLLERSVTPGSRILDVGSGSGVLSIAAAHLGAGEVLALEGDPLAMEALADNIERNDAGDRVACREVWVDGAQLAGIGTWDGVIANIESGILRGLRLGFRAALPPDGWLILSGILAEEWPSLELDFQEVGFVVTEIDRDGDWVAVRLVIDARDGDGLRQPS